MVKAYKIILIILFASTFIFLYNYHISYSLKTDDDIINSISKVKKINVDEITILKLDKKGKYKSVLYSMGKSDQYLIIFERSIFLIERYYYKGFSYSSEEISGHSWSTPKESLFLVYGNNLNLKADKCIIFYDGDKSLVQEINSKGEFLYTYIFSLKKQSGIKCIFLDDDGNILKELLY